MDAGYHILRVRTGFDFDVAERLTGLGIESVSVPVTKTTRHHRSKKKIVRVHPLLSGYVFARVPGSAWRAVKSAEGVIGPLRAAGGTGYPVVVGDSVVTGLQEASERGASESAAQCRFAVGERTTFDLFTERVEAVIKSIKGDVVEATAEISGKCVTITRVADQFGAVA